EYYLHRLDGMSFASPAFRAPTSGPVPERADADKLHHCYSALLALLQLSKSHRQALQQRGLTDAEIDRRGYASLPMAGRARIAQELQDRFKEALLAVPGFYVKEKDVRSYTTIAGAAGLLVPVRDVKGRIIALKVRRDDAENGPRYSYLSSARRGG